MGECRDGKGRLSNQDIGLTEKLEGVISHLHEKPPPWVHNLLTLWPKLASVFPKCVWIYCDE
jgi:hypothetical protein